MNRSEYLLTASDRLSRLLGDRGFETQRNMLRSKDLLMKLSPDELAGMGYTYSAERLTRNCLFIFEVAARLVDAGGDIPGELEGGLKNAAEVFEHLASLQEGPRKEMAALLSASLYEIAGYQANSACLARSLELPPLPEAITPASVAALLARWVALSLRRQFVRVQMESRALREGMPPLRSAGLAEIENFDLHPDAVLTSVEVAILSEMFLSFSLFLLRGEGESLNRAQQELQELLTLLLNTGRPDELLMVRVLHLFMRELARNSTWSWLAPQISSDPLWNRYALLLARGSAQNPLEGRGIVELWKSQQLAVASGLLRGEGHGLVVRMPTSAGKTRIAELAIMNVLDVARDDHKVVYVAPFRALSDEVERNMADTFSDLGFRVSSVLGSFELDPLEDYLLQETDLLITTPEKLDLLSRARPSFFANVRLLILDEGHVIDDIERGARYELLLTRLKLLMPDEAQVLFISAVMPEENARQFATWLCNDANAVIATDWRPARQLLGRLRWHTDTAEIEYPEEAPSVGTRPPFVPRAIRITEYRDFTLKLRREKTTRFPTKTYSDTAAELAVRFAEHGPVLVFATQTPWAEACARAIIRGLQLRRQTDEGFVPRVFRQARERIAGSAAMESAIAWLGNRSLQVEALQVGVGIHHGGVPEAVRKATEEDFRRGVFPVMVATNTLAQGVNLPIKTVVVHKAARYQRPSGGEEDGRMEAIGQREFWNVCGRAGRAGWETEGQIIFVAINEDDLETFSFYSSRAYEPIRGRLYEVLRELEDGRITTEDFAKQLDSEILAILTEEVVATDVGERIERILGRSLVTIEAGAEARDMAPLTNAARAVAERISSRIPDPERRKVFSLTGLRVTSCEEIADAVEANSNYLRPLLINRDAPLDQLLSALFEVIQPLPQMQPQYSFQADYLALLMDWLQQTPVDDLRETYTSSDTEAQRFYRFVADYFGFRLPWGISGYLRIAKHLLGIEEDLPDTQKFLPSMVKYGVSHPFATWPMTLGCPDRRLASLIAQGFRTDVPDGNLATFMTWFSSLNEEDFVYRFAASSHQARALSEKARFVVAERRDFVRLVRSRPERIDARLVGVQYEGRETHALDLAEGSDVTLQRDYLNPYDRNAIGVNFRGSQIGFVERRIARLVAPELDSGIRLAAKVVSLKRDPSLRFVQLELRRVD